MARRKSQPDPDEFLGSLEARVMTDLWRHGESTVNDVLDRLNAGRAKQLAYNTVMSVMARLADKGLLDRERHGRAFVYWPAMDRDKFVEHQAARTAQEFMEEFGVAAVSGFVTAAAERPALLEELERKLRGAQKGDGG